MRIIAVDDEKLALESLSRAIKAIVTEDEVVSFRYAEDALEYARENACDIAFLDIEMVGMSGVELAAELKKYNSEINIVFCTGYGNYRDAAFELHASGYLMKPITPEKVKTLAAAAEACWQAILKKDLEAFAAAYKSSFEAQIAMFPGMVAPTYIGHPEQDNSYVAETIAHYSAMDDVLAWKMPGAGGGGYLALVVKDAKEFVANHLEAFELQIRRE